ncbi:hypothetical protein BACEGG_02750 [Bacteroides eggerthii DSM 20697]|nr:hypothetical protein BACEGG_02750 [Bacteroides eggerthii DSM 20697]
MISIIRFIDFLEVYRKQMYMNSTVVARTEHFLVVSFFLF